MRVTMTTGGSRGDVQPYVALGKQLQQEGVNVRVATAPYFESLVRHAGLDFYPVSIDLQQVLNELLQEQSSNPITQAMGLRRHLGPLLETNIEEFTDAAQDADLLFQTPATFIAYYVAEHLGIPSVAAEMQPAIRGTGEFRSAIMPPLPPMPTPRLRAICNRLSYVFAHEVFWAAFRGPVNKIITRELGLPRAHAITSFDQSRKSSTRAADQALCGWSPAVLPKPQSWGDNVHVTGYWFLDDEADWQPPQELVEFLEAGSKPIAIGFGSTTTIDPDWLAEVVIGALRRTGDRAVLLTGWSELSDAGMPDEVFTLKQAPHQWLFPRVSAAVHHCGSATVGASLRAGIPTIPVPFWFDQFFWAEQTAALGAGPEPIPASRLSAQSLADAIKAATSDESMRLRASSLGQQISNENGASAAVSALERRGLIY